MSALDRPHYRLLVALARRGTISAAARELFITQSAASQRLREAERRVGFALTVRTGRSVALTPAALRLVEGAERSERALTAAEADASWLATSGEPSLQLAHDVHDLLWWLPEVLGQVDRDPTCTTIELLRTGAGEGVRAVLDRRADAIVTPHAPDGASGRHLFDDRLVALVSIGGELAGRDALAPEEFADCDYVTYSTTPHDGFEHATFFARHGIWPRRILRLESVSLLVSTVAAGGWVSILPRWSIPTDPRLAVVPLDPEPPSIAWQFVARDLDAQPVLAATADRLFELLRELHADQ